MVIPHKGGLPHSDTQGSTPARGFPWIFAACHVLHRLLAPRHPPDALLLLIPRPRTRAHGHSPKTPPCTETIHCPNTPGSNGSRPTAKPSLSTHFYVLNAAASAETLAPAGSALRPEAARAAPNAQVRHPGQTRHGPPLPIPPNRITRPNKTHRGVLRVQNAPEPDSQSTKNTRAPGPKRQTPPSAVIPRLKPKPSLSMTPPRNPWVGALRATTSLARPQGWRRTGSNRRPPACKAGALPIELRPHHQNQATPKPNANRPGWWAREDSNLRPHAYQACALTN